MFSAWSFLLISILRDFQFRFLLIKKREYSFCGNILSFLNLKPKPFILITCYYKQPTSKPIFPVLSDNRSSSKRLLRPRLEKR